MENEIYFYLPPSIECPPAGGLWINDTGIITGAGASHYHWLPNYVCPHVLLSGCGTVRTPTGEFKLGVGDMFSLWPGVDIEYFKDPDDPWRVHWIYLVGPMASSFCGECGFGPEHPTLRPARPEDVIRGFADVYETFRRGGDIRPYRVLSMLYGILDACRGSHVENKSVGNDAFRRALVVRAEALTDSALPGGLNVMEMAEALKVSRTTLFTAFRDILGTTPIEHLTCRRIERAKDLMLRTRHTLASIASMSGFGEPKYFLRRFRQIEGMTPTEWRRQKIGIQRKSQS